jgi:hypothetical protein
MGERGGRKDSTNISEGENHPKKIKVNNLTY